MKISFNKNIQKFVIRTFAKLVKVEHYMGYPTELRQGNEYYLSYHYNRVYFNYCIYSNGGFIGPGSQTPLTNILMDEQRMDAAKILFRRDKKNGIIPADYPFK